MGTPPAPNHCSAASLPHVIRLRGPWQVSNPKHAVPTASTVRLPADLATLLARAADGNVRLQRNFGRPSNLQATDRVELVIERLAAVGELSLNGARLGALAGPAERTRFVITPLLQTRNELQLHLKPHADSTTNEVLDVRIEISSC